MATLAPVIPIIPPARPGTPAPEYDPRVLRIAQMMCDAGVTPASLAESEAEVADSEALTATFAAPLAALIAERDRS